MQTNLSTRPVARHSTPDNNLSGAEVMPSLRTLHGAEERSKRIPRIIGNPELERIVRAALRKAFFDGDPQGRIETISTGEAARVQFVYENVHYDPKYSNLLLAVMRQERLMTTVEARSRLAGKDIRMSVRSEYLADPSFVRALGYALFSQILESSPDASIREISLRNEEPLSIAHNGITFNTTFRKITGQMAKVHVFGISKPSDARELIASYREGKISRKDLDEKALS